MHKNICTVREVWGSRGSIRIMVSWFMTPCLLVDGYKCILDISWLQLYVIRVCSRCLQNFGTILLKYKALHPYVYGTKIFDYAFLLFYTRIMEIMNILSPPRICPATAQHEGKDRFPYNRPLRPRG